MEKSRLARLNHRVFPLSLFAHSPETWKSCPRKRRRLTPRTFRKTQQCLPTPNGFQHTTQIPQLKARLFLKTRTASKTPGCRLYHPHTFQLSSRAKMTMYAPKPPVLALQQPPRLILPESTYDLTYTPSDSHEDMSLKAKLRHLKALIEDPIMFADPYTVTK